MEKTAILSPSVLIFGLDGATWKLLDPWLKRKKLPFLQDLIKNGAKGILKSTFPSLTSTAWVSFQTGAPPETHGVLGFLKENGTLFNSSDIKLPSFWEIAGKNGKRCAIINMPLTFPPKPIHGVLTTCFLTPPGQEFVYPPSLEKKLIQLGYPQTLAFERSFHFKNGLLSAKEKQRFLSRAKKIINVQRKTAEYIMKRASWDIFFLFFKITDIAQHLFWRGKETLGVYQKIDQTIKSLYQRYEKQNPKRKITLFIVSDHGFHPAPKKDLCFYPLLEKLGFLSRPPKWQLKLLRGARKMKFFTPKKMKIYDYGVFGEKNNLKSLAKKLKNIKIEGKKAFQEIEIKNNWLFWRLNPYFAPNSDPLSEKITYLRNDHLKARHDSDRNGIFVATGIKMQKKVIEITEVTPMILKLLDIPLSSFKRNLPKKHSLSKKDEEVIKKRLAALGYT